MKRCPHPQCGKEFPDHAYYCSDHGAELVPVRAEPPETEEDPLGLVGSVLMGRYEVRKWLGGGGFADVYQVLNHELERDEAIKLIWLRNFRGGKNLTAAQHQDWMRLMFRQEAVLMARLGGDSHHIVPVYHSGEWTEEQALFFTMEYMAGGSVLDLVLEEHPIPLPRALRLLRQLCEALKVAHDVEVRSGRGVIHRDLKLDNLLLDSRGETPRLKVADFGIAKLLADTEAKGLTSKYGSHCTAGCAPPEQVLKSGRVDARTDLFAVGVVAYELLTAHEPWDRRRLPERLDQSEWSELLFARGPLRAIPPREFRPELPTELQTIVLRLLEKDPGKRFQSGAELDAELARIQRIVDPATTGALHVESAPPGVRVRLMQRHWIIAQGNTPWDADGLQPGSYRIEVAGWRYRRESWPVAVRRGETTTLTVQPTPRWTWLAPVREISARFGRSLTRPRVATIALATAAIFLSLGLLIPVLGRLVTEESRPDPPEESSASITVEDEMRMDLRRLRFSQLFHHRRTGEYTSDLSALRLPSSWPSPGVTVRIDEAGADSWRAHATHDSADVMCRIAVLDQYGSGAEVECGPPGVSGSSSEIATASSSQRPRGEDERAESPVAATGSDGHPSDSARGATERRRISAADIERIREGYSVIRGTVVDARSGLPIESAVVSVLLPFWYWYGESAATSRARRECPLYTCRGTTNAQGDYSIPYPVRLSQASEDTIWVEACKQGYTCRSAIWAARPSGSMLYTTIQQRVEFRLPPRDE